MNPEFGVFGVAKDTNEDTNPTALASVGDRAPARSSPTSPTTSRPTRSGGRAGRPSRRPTSPAGGTGRATLISERAGPNADAPWAHPNSRFTTTLANVPEHRARLRRPEGRADRRDHLRRPHPRPRAADPRDHRPRRGRLRRPDARRRGDVRRRGRRGAAALRPDVDAPVHVLPRGRLRRALAEDHRRRHRPADLRARQLVPARPRGRPLPAGPATATTCAPLLWLLQLKNGEVTGRQTPVGIIPTEEELDLEGVDITPEDLETILSHRHRALAQEMGTARSTSSSSPTCPRRSGRPTAGSRRRSTTRTERRGGPGRAAVRVRYRRPDWPEAHSPARAGIPPGWDSLGLLRYGP